MIVYTNREIYSYGSGKKTKSERQTQMKDTSKEVASLSREENKAKRQNEKERIKNEKALDRQSLKEERGKKREENKSNRQGFFKKIRAKINAKRLIRLRDKSGKERILYPITRLKRNKDNKLVKTYPNGQETIVNDKNVVLLPKDISDKDQSPAFVDRTEIAKITNLSPEQITTQSLNNLVAFVPKVVIKEEIIKESENESDKTKTNTATIQVTGDKVVIDENGNAFVEGDIDTNPYANSDDIPATNIADEAEKYGNSKPTKPPMSLTKKILIGTGITLVVALLGYVGYRMYTKK